MEVPTRNVDITSPFWAQIRNNAREKTIPALIKAQKESGHWDCLRWKEGHDPQPHPFWDSDVYKTIEAACYFLMEEPDDNTKALVEEAVDNIRAAQHPDGYINSYYTVRGLKDRWTNLRDNHELYCIGHLIEACVAYETLTNNGRLLEPVMKVVKHIDSIFGLEPGKQRGYPGHEEIEIGLLRLYELTSEPLLLKLAEYFLLERGTRDDKGETYFDKEAWARGNDPRDYSSFEMRPVYRRPRDYAYHQADCKLVDATEINGHSVRAMYFLTAATDLYRLTGNEEVKAAVDRLWRDMVDKKMYITGGLGSVKQWEGFGHPYVLGDTEEGGCCYAETCATFGLINWCQRMLRIDLKSEYADVMEIALYNGFLGAIGLDGESFYYENPLRTFTGSPKERSRWFEVACCPPNVAKLLGNLGPYIYSVKDGRVAIHLYISSTFRVPGGETIITIRSGLPWSGDVEISWTGPVMLALRILGWSGKSPTWIPGREVKDGYIYITSEESGSMSMGYLMPMKMMYPNPIMGKNEVCIMRGPLVYCLEDVDNNIDVDRVAVLPGRYNLRVGPTIDIGGHEMNTVVAKGRELNVSKSKLLYDSDAFEKGEMRYLTFIPFFARANRGGNGGMRVWCFSDVPTEPKMVYS